MVRRASQSIYNAWGEQGQILQITDTHDPKYLTLIVLTSKYKHTLQAVKGLLTPEEHDVATNSTFPRFLIC